MPNEEPYEYEEENITTEEQIQEEIDEIQKLLIKIQDKKIPKNQKWEIIQKITELIESFQDQEYDKDFILKSRDWMPTEIAVLLSQKKYEQVRKVLRAELDQLLKEKKIPTVKVMSLLRILLIATFLASNPDRDPATPHPLDGLPEQLKAQVMKILFPEWTQWRWINGGTWEEIHVPSF